MTSLLERPATPDTAPETSRGAATRVTPEPTTTDPTPGRRRTYSAGGVISALVMFVILVVFLPLYAVNGTEWEGDALNQALVWFIVAYSAGSIAQLCLRGGGSIVRLGYSVFMYVFMGISVFAQLWSQTFPIHLTGTGAYSPAEIRIALLVVIIAIAAFEGGFQLRRILRAKQDHAPEVAGPTRGFYVDEKRTLILAVIGLAFAAYLISKTGIAPFFDSRQATGNAVLGNTENAVIYSGADKASGAIISRFAQGPCLIALFGLLYLRHHKLPVRTTIGATTVRNVITVLLIVVNLIINNPIANSRFWFGTVAITLVSVYIPLRRDVAIRIVSVLTMIVLLFGFTSLQAFRYNGGAKSYSLGFHADLVESGSYSEFTMIMIGNRWLDENEYTLGYQLLGSVLVFVPRSVWTDKPVDTGNLVLPISNPASPLWGEGDVEAGPIGVLIYFALLGYAVAALDRKFRRSRPGDLANAVVPIFGGFVIFVLRGSLLQVFGAGYMLMFGIVFIGARRVVDRTAVPADEAPAVTAVAVARPKRRQRQWESDLPSSSSSSGRSAA